jgi:hypothetical protein
MINTIGSETDKSGEVLEIKSSDSILAPSLYCFYLRHYADLVSNRYAFPMIKLDFSTYRVVFAEKNNQVIGIILYDCLFAQGRKYATIILSAVDFPNRQRGIYKILRKYLEKEIKMLGCEYLTSYVWKANDVRIKILNTDVLKADYIVYGKHFN